MVGSEYSIRFLSISRFRRFQWAHQNIPQHLYPSLPDMTFNVPPLSSNIILLSQPFSNSFSITAQARPGRLIFQYASFNNSRSLHFFLAAWPIVGIWFTALGISTIDFQLKWFQFQPICS